MKLELKDTSIKWTVVCRAVFLLMSGYFVVKYFLFVKTLFQLYCEINLYIKIFIFLFFLNKGTFDF